MWHKFHWLLLATMSLLLGSVGQVKADTVVYATADNGVTNLFGTIDLTTGLFTQISTTTPLFCSLTAGIGGMIYGGDGNAPLNLYTISPSAHRPSTARSRPPAIPMLVSLGSLRRERRVFSLITYPSRLNTHSTAFPPTAPV